MALRLVAFVGSVLGLTTAAGHALAQQPVPQRGPQNEIEAAQQAAKTAAGFEFLGTLARTCLLPPSRSEDARDVPAPYVSDPGKAPARATWYAEPAKVFDNLYFVGGKIHSAWALTTREGISFSTRSFRTTRKSSSSAACARSGSIRRTSSTW